MKHLSLLPILSLLPLLNGCQSTTVSRTSTDGSKVTFSSLSLFSNTAVKGLNVDGTTKTTTNLLRITGGATEPNVESITATSDALGNIIGTAIATGAKGVKP